MYIYTKSVLLCAACSFFLMANSPTYGAQSQVQSFTQEKTLTPQKQDLQEEKLITDENEVFDRPPG